MAKIKRDDEVIVITGKDKGKRGKVVACSKIVWWLLASIW
jgi:ribosomal protein L24